MEPEYLYKYGQLSEFSEDLFANPRIWFPKPTDLNDPFECRPKFSYDGTDAEIKEFLANCFMRKNPSMSPRDVDILVDDVFKRGGHRDPGVLQRSNDDVLAALAHEIGVYCLSRVPDSILMWSHYGKNHSGYCLKFEATDQTPVFGTALSVIYSDQYPCVDFFNTPHDEQVDKIFLTKYTGWSYEQEYRIIDHRSGPGPRDYPEELLKGVIFGSRMPKDDEEKIRLWTSRRDSPVDFYRAVQSTHGFSIEVVKLD